MKLPIIHYGIIGDPLSEEAIRVLFDHKCCTAFVSTIEEIHDCGVIYFTGQETKWVNRHVRHVVVQTDNDAGLCLCLGVALRENKKGQFSYAVLNAARAAERLLASDLDTIPAKYRSESFNPWLAKYEDDIRSLQTSIRYQSQGGINWVPNTGLWPVIKKSPVDWRIRHRAKVRERLTSGMTN